MKHRIAFVLLLFVLASCSKTTTPAPQASAQKELGFYYQYNDSLFFYNIVQRTSTFIFKGYDASVSPDGNTIAYTDDVSDTTRFDVIRYIALYDTATKLSHRLTNIPGHNSFGPRFSPEGRSLLFDHWDTVSGDWFVALIDTDNTHFRIITPRRKEAFNGYCQPIWCSDGSGFICQNLDSLFVFSPTGSPREVMPMNLLVPDSNFGISSASKIFSFPEHHWYVVEAGSDMEDADSIEHYGIFVFDTQTKHSIRVTPDSLHCFDPHWVEGAGQFFVQGYSSADLTAADIHHTQVAFKLFAVDPNGSGFHQVNTR